MAIKNSKDVKDCNGEREEFGISQHQWSKWQITNDRKHQKRRCANCNLTQKVSI